MSCQTQRILLLIGINNLRSSYLKESIARRIRLFTQAGKQTYRVYIFRFCLTLLSLDGRAGIEPQPNRSLIGQILQYNSLHDERTSRAGD